MTQGSSSRNGDGALAGRVVLVAGAGGPVGAAVAAACVRAGATVVAVRRRPNDESHYWAADLTDDTAVAELAGRVRQDHGPIHALVNAAHPAHRVPATIADLTASALETELDGLRIHANLCRNFLPQLRSHADGRVVFISGALARRPAAGQAGYGAAKSAAETYTRYLALEEGRNGVTANIVALGRVLDPEAPEPPADMVALAEQLRARLSLNDFPSTHQVAEVVTTLLVDRSAALTGQTLWVTGGEPML